MRRRIGRNASATNSRGAQDGDRGHLRRRVQFRRPLLRDVRPDTGHDARPTTARAAPIPRFASPSASARSDPILVAQSAKGVCAILLGDDPDALVRDLQDRFPRATLVGGDAAFEQTVAKVVGFVEAAGARPRPAAGRARHGIPAARLAALRRDSRGCDGQLRRDSGADRLAERRARGCAGVRRKRTGRGDSLSSCRENRRIALRLSVGCRAQANLLAREETE